MLFAVFSSVCCLDWGPARLGYACSTVSNAFLKRKEYCPKKCRTRTSVNKCRTYRKEQSDQKKAARSAVLSPALLYVSVPL